MLKAKNEDLHGFQTAGSSKSSRKPENEEGFDKIFMERMQKLNISSDSDSDAVSDSDSDEELDSDFFLTDSECGDSDEDATDRECACSYCGIYDPLCVAECLKCSKWFCNGVKSGNKTSHIVNHMMKSGHHEIALHPESILGDGIRIECYNCGCKNALSLGYANSNDNMETVLLCRQPCARDPLKVHNWNLDSWAPIIQNLRLLPWLCQYPSDEQVARAGKIDSANIQKLEQLWKAGQNEATIEDLECVKEEEGLNPTQLAYETPAHFRTTMYPLLVAEAEVEKQLKEAMKLENATIRWDPFMGKAPIFWFSRPSSEVIFRIIPGDEIVISHPNPSSTSDKWTATGSIINVPHDVSSMVPVELHFNQNCPTEVSTGYTIEFTWNETTLKRQLVALSYFVKMPTCMTRPVKNYILGRNPSLDDKFNQLKPPNKIAFSPVPNLPLLNASQKQAVQAALERPFTLIQGPPGTGKTVTSASIVYHLAYKGAVLVVASSNVAVDHLTEKLHKTGLRVVRITSKFHDLKESPLSFLSLHRQAISSSKSPILLKLHKMKLQGSLSNEDQRKYIELLKVAENQVLEEANVVCCTCIGAGDRRIVDLEFDSVLIDEATQATETEALISLVHGVKQVVMVGDHKQLGPVVLSSACKKAQFERSMFERLMQMGTKPIRLQVQYRMHPALAEFPSDMFYGGALQNGVSAASRICPELLSMWPKSEIPMFLLHCSGAEELASTGVSYLNRVEANGVEKIVTNLLNASIKPSQIGVITPYQGQRAYIMQTMFGKGPLKREVYEAIEVASVDAFQGREKDFIILSLVRSNDNSTIGFVADPRRMNVALTRARYGLIILGNSDVLSKSYLWKNLINQFKKSQLLMEGTFEDMRPRKM